MHSQGGYRFSVRMCIPGETHPIAGEAHPIPGEANLHSWRGFAFPVSHIAIPGEDVYSLVIHHILTGNGRGGGDVPHWECTYFIQSESKICIKNQMTNIGT